MFKLSHSFLLSFTLSSSSSRIEFSSKIISRIFSREVFEIS